MEPLFLKLVVEGLRDGDHSVLGGVVGADVGVRGVACDRAGVHDVAVAVLHEVGQKHPDAVDHAPQVHPEGPLPVGGGQFVHLSACAHTGVVAHHVHLPKPGKGGFGQFVHVSLRTHVGEHAHCIHTGIVQFGHCGVHGRALHIADQDAGPGGAESVGHGPAHSAGPPGDDCCFALKSVHGPTLPPACHWRRCGRRRQCPGGGSFHLRRPGVLRVRQVRLRRHPPPSGEVSPPPTRVPPMSTVNAVVMYPLAMEESELDDLHRRFPGVQFHNIGYFEPHGLRDAKAKGRVTEELLATAPALSEGERATIAEADVLMALDLPHGIWDWNSRLRWVQAIGAGIGQLEPAKFKATGVVLTNAAGVASTPIAEFAIGRLLEVWKDIRVLERQQKDRNWKMHQGLLMKGKTVGIVGLGAIGRDVARRAKAFEMTVLANRRSAQPGDTDPDVDELFGPDGLDEMLARCDAVVLSAPHTPETIDLFDAERLERLKPGVVLVNVGRGTIIDEAALVAALESGQVGAAVLDVTREEPLPADSPLWDAPNMYLSPHCSTAREGYNEALMDLFCDNLERFLADVPSAQRGRPRTGLLGMGIGQ